MVFTINRLLSSSCMACFTALIIVSVTASSSSQHFCATQRPSNCSCTAVNNKTHRLQCRAFTVTVSKLNVEIQCVSNDVSDFTVLNSAHIGRTLWLIIKHCALPSVSLSQFMRNMGLSGIRGLQVIYPVVHGDFSMRELFRGLSSVTNLVLHIADVTQFSDAFTEVNNLIYLSIAFNNTSLPSSIFCSLQKLTHLELISNNQIYLRPGIFHCLKKLNHLILNGSIHNISRSVFSDVQNINDLSILLNNMSVLPQDIFKELPILNHISLNSNEFLSLPHNLFTNNVGLETVTIEGNRRTLKTLPPGFLVNLTELENVEIINCNMNTLPQDLVWGSRSILDMSLTKNNFTSLPELLFRDSVELGSLDVSLNQITDLPNQLFSKTRNLKTLKLNNNQLTDIKDDLFSSLVQLRELNLANNRLKHIGLQAFPGWCSLRSINMTNNFLTFNVSSKKSPLYRCKKLEYIGLSNNSVTKIITDWTEMNYLANLNLSHNQISQIQAADLRFLTYKTIFIDISYNKITKINFSDADTIYRLPIGNDKHYVYSLRQRYFNIIGNAFYDNCKVYSLVELTGKHFSSVIFFMTDNLHYVQTKSQPPMVEYIPLKKLTCLLNKVDNPTCPEQCSCLYRLSDNSIVVNCSQKNFSSMPKAVPEVGFSIYIELILSKNNIKVVNSPLGPGYCNVTKYILSDNVINEIDLAAFSPRLQVLELDGNNITQFNKSSIKFLKNATNLTQLTFHQNPWKCDCTTVDSVSLIQFLYVSKKIKQLENTTCENGKEIWNVSEIEMCSVESQTVLGLLFATTLFITLTLLFGLLTLYYRFQKEIKVWLYGNNCCLWFISEEELDEDKVYDAFVSYAYPDEDFVVDHLIPELENGPIRYRLCLHQRDWIPGEMIPTQIARSVEQSRRTIIVLSKSFLNSGWGRMEFCVAHTQALRERRVRVIVIVYGDIGKTEKLDAELRAYLTMNTYVKWGDPFFWEKLRYALPHR